MKNLNIENEKLFFTLGIEKHNDKLYYFAERCNQLISIDPKNGIMETEVVPKPAYYRSIVSYKDRILMFPGGRGEVCEYYPDEGIVQYIDMPDGLHNEDEINWSARYIRNDDMLYFYWADPIITVYNLRTNEWKVYRGIEDEKIGDGCFFSPEAFFLESNIYFFMKDSDKCVILDKNADEIRVEIIRDCDINQPKTMQINGINTYLTYSENEAYAMDYKNGVLLICDHSGNIKRKVSLKLGKKAPKVVNPMCNEGVFFDLNKFIAFIGKNERKEC